MRFTIKGLMLVVVVAAGLSAVLARLVAFRMPLWLMAIPCLFLIGGWGLWFWRCRRTAAVGFVGLSLLTNALYIVAGIYPDYMLEPALRLGWLVILFPLMGALGIAWTCLATHANAPSRRAPFLAWASVIIFTAMPVITLSTLWPLHLAFLAFRPSMERLADRVLAGHEIASPQWIGPFRVVASGADHECDSVGLFVDPNPNGRTGFVRIQSNSPASTRFDLLIGTDTHVELGGGWSYRQDD